MKAERIAIYSLAAVCVTCLIVYFGIEYSRFTDEMRKDARNAAAIPTWAAETKAARDQRIDREVKDELRRLDAEVESRLARGESAASIMSSFDRREEAKRQESILAELQALRRELSERKRKGD